MDEIVITVNGNSCKKSECRLINKEYYLIGDVNVENSGDVYNIDGRYIRFSTGRIVFNHSTKSYQLKNEFLSYGIIDMDEDCEFTMGYFNSDLNTQQLINKNGDFYQCINEDIINKSFREELSTGVFHHISRKRACLFNKIYGVKREYKESLKYDSKGIMDKYINRYNLNYNPVINNTIQKYSKAIGNLTFGFEFETTKGMIPSSRLLNLPLIPLRDGSIEGLEYVTIPLKGDKGVKAIIDCVKELNKRTVYNNDCSLHLHIGNIPRTPEFILAFYKLISNYQEDIFSLFPLYKKYNFGIKRKNYSKPFPLNDINFRMDPSIKLSNANEVNKNFDILFTHLSGGKSFYDYDCDLNNVNFHPLDVNGNQKWNIKNRYYAHNLIPLIFGNKETIEFRIHTPTYDVDKILNFLFISSYLINYAIENQKYILENPDFLYNMGGNGISTIICKNVLKLKELNSVQKESLCDYHLNYIEERRRITYNDNCRGDIVGKEENIYCYKSIDWEEKINNNYEYKQIPDIYSYDPSLQKPIFSEKSLSDQIEHIKKSLYYGTRKSALNSPVLDSISTTIAVNEWMYNAEKDTIIRRDLNNPYSIVQEPLNEDSGSLFVKAEEYIKF